MVFYVSDEQIQSYHNKDRLLFIRMVFGLGRDPAQSLHVVAFFMWLSEIGYPCHIEYILSLPDIVLNALAEEINFCLRWIEAEKPPAFYARNIPLMSGVLRVDITPFYLYENRFHAIRAVARNVNGLSRGVSDIMQQHPDMRALHNAEWRGRPIEQGASSSNPFGRVRYMEQGASSSNPQGRPRIMEQGATSSPHSKAAHPIIASTPLDQPSEFLQEWYLIRLVNMWALHPHFPTVPVFKRHGNTVLTPFGVPINPHPPQLQGPILHNSQQGPLLQHPPFVNTGGLGDLASWPTLHQAAGNQPPQPIGCPTGGRRITRSHAQIVEDERTMFMTFSRGYPLTEHEVRDYFTGKYGQCIESVYMEQTLFDVQPLYARVVFFNSETINKILKGRDRVKFVINGKHIWTRRFISKRRSPPPAPPQTPPPPPPPPPSPPTATAAAKKVK